MTERKKLINICLISLMAAVIVVVMLINVFSMINNAEADIGDDLIVESMDTDTARVVKVKNILRYRSQFDNNDGYIVERNVYKALGYSSEQINNMDESELEKLKNADELEVFISEFYVDETPITRSSNDEDTVIPINVSIAGPGQLGETESTELRKSMILTLTVQRDASQDGVAGVINKDTGNIENVPYLGLRVSMSLLWESGHPVTKLKDKLIIFSSKSMMSNETKLLWNDGGEQSQILTPFQASNYYSYDVELSDKNNIKGIEGEYVYEAYNGSASFNFRVVYLHHTMASVGFNGNITINSDIMDVDVGGAVTHAKYKSPIYTINAA